MNTKLAAQTGLMLLLAVGLGKNSSAATPEDARNVAQANADAVVTVQLVIETSFEGESEKHENKTSATGTVIDPSGLVVTSLATTNPGEIYRQFMDENTDMKFSSKVVDIKIEKADGTEIPADLVLRDPDLDLAFIRPKKAPEAPLPYIDLKQGQQSLVLDEILVLSRLGNLANHALASCLDRVQAVVTKPRTFYVVNPYMHSSPGGPAFTMDGKPLGILLLRASPSKEPEPTNVEDMFTTVILPCATVAAIAEQAKTAAPIKEVEKPAAAKTAAKAQQKPAAKAE